MSCDENERTIDQREEDLKNDGISDSLEDLEPQHPDEPSYMRCYSIGEESKEQ